MAISISNSTLVARYAGAVYGIALGGQTMNEILSSVDDTNNTVDSIMNAVYLRDHSSLSTAAFATQIATNLGLTGSSLAEGIAYITGHLNATAAEQRGAKVNEILNLFANLTNDPVFGTAATEYNNDVAWAVSYAQAGNAANADFDTRNGTDFIFNVAVSTSGTATVGRLTGNADARIDLTGTANQIKGLDLDMDGVVEIDGKENVNPTTLDDTSNFKIIDAYSRNPLNHKDAAQNYLGDIAFDGTGFAGDGVNTDGNIFLGGLGTDTAYGGIGNDFLAGGGVAQGRTGGDSLSGGRNSDFFFAELSDLDATDGDFLTIDGGTTADDNSAGLTQSAQDADWMLFEASDDDEPVTIRLRDDTTVDAGEATQTDVGSIVSRGGTQIGTMRDIENFDASGNLYGFLDNVNVSLGGKTAAYVAGQPNNGIGASAQIVVIGSEVANIIVAGYDNDRVEGNGGNDILLGGNLDYLINPNLVGITNDGRDELFGGAGNDHIVFEADGGIVEGDATQNVIGGASDTLWITKNALGTQTAADMTTDGVLRFDLDSQNIDMAAGYGGADVGDHDNVADDNQDQTNYKAGVSRTTVQDMENVIVTGLGAIDYDTDGTNSGDVAHLSQVNIKAYNGDVDLRGTAGVNVLYANTGNDTVEGRSGGTLSFNNAGVVTADGRDKLSGGDGLDTFIFGTTDGTSAGVQGGYGDGVDVIHRQADANADNIWDGYNAAKDTGNFVQDFGVNSSSLIGASSLVIDFLTTNLADPNVAVTGFEIKIGGVAFTVVDNAGLIAANNATEIAALVNSAFNAQDAKVSAVASGNTVVITDQSGRDMSDTLAEGFLVTLAVPNGQGGTQATFAPAGTTTFLDKLVYASYEDRADGELTDDDAVLGSHISLGLDSYAEDRVVDFSADGTRIAEDQTYDVKFANLTTQDKVTLKVNNVEYSLQVGVDLDGNIIAAEDGIGGDPQINIQSAFLNRLNDFINSFMDDDTAAGKVSSTLIYGTTPQTVAVDLNNDGDTLDAGEGASVDANGDGDFVDVGDTLINNIIGLKLIQDTYNGEETVFMSTPTVTLENLSGGQVATATVDNVSNHEVHLLDFNGTNNKLNADNVLFLGNTGTSQSILATAKTAGGALTGSEADIVDSGVNDLAGYARNTNTNDALKVNNFSVHGDDFLMGGDGNDTITGLTGDDRVMGSKGTDTADGGKNYYAVQVLGETEARVFQLNKWEAANSASVTALSGLTISSITLINQSETGASYTSGVFDDTLQFEQADFSANTKFTVNLNGFVGNTAATVQFRNDGAGVVSVDDAGDGTINGTTTFTNFENIRTVSGTGKAVAGSGQGDDTLDVSALSTAAGGVSYDLTNDGTAGDVNYGKDATVNQKALAAGTAASLLAGATVASVKAAIVGAESTLAFQNAVNAIAVTGSTTVAGFLASVGALADLVRPTSLLDTLVNQVGADHSDYETTVIKVDGVENVIAGNGADLLVIDETEAAKNNSFTGTLGNDRIEYQNDFGVIAAEPTVTIKLDTIAAVSSAASGVDTVTMTGGRVGSTVAVDTLTAVERITIAGNTAQGTAEADLIDVTAMATGAVVDYTNGQVRDLGGVVHLTVEGITQFETVWADGNDRVVVADAAVMNTNARSDEGVDATPDQNILFMTYADFDDLNALATTRKTFASQVADDTVTNVINQGQFTFSLSKVGTEADVDRVDYSAETGRIVAAVGQGTATTPQYIVVDGDSDNDWTNAESRVDRLESVEEIVASLGESVLDFTTVNAARQVTFQYVNPAANPAENAVLEQTIRIADGNGNTISGLNTFVEKYTYNKTTPAVADATWNRVEGGDLAEVIIYQGSEDLVNQGGLDHRYTTDTLTLRGGNNEVRYSPIETSITAAITVTEENLATTAVSEGLISASITFQDGVGGALSGGGTHTITSYTSDNTTAAGTLKIEGSQDAEDTVSFTTSSKKVFVLGTSPGVINVNIGSLNAMVLTGFERLADSNSNDVYDFASLGAVAGVTLIDDAAPSTDHDTIKVKADAINYNASGAGTIDLDNLSATVGGFNMDFDILDVTGVTSSGLILNGGSNAAPVNGLDTDTTDEVVLGALNLVTSTTDFETVVLTATTVTAGTAFTFNAGTSLVQGSTTVNTTSSELSFGGTVRELGTTAATGLTIYGTPHVANVTTGVTVNVGTAGATVHGGDGADTLNGGAAADTLRGGAGNDSLNGGVAGEVRFIQINPTGASGAAATATTITLDGLVLTLNNVAGAPVDVDANAGDNLDITAAVGSNAVGAALATLVNANLADINDGVRFGGTQLLSAAYSDTTGNLTFTFVAGTDVAVTDTIAVAGAGLGAITVAAEAVVTNGGSGGNDIYIVDAGTDTISNLNGSDVLVVYGGATATASGVSSFTATASTVNLGTVTINAAATGSTIDLSSAAAISGGTGTATNGFTVVGGAGVDNFTGSAKADTFTGAAGADVFTVLHNNATVDTFVDFVTGVDQINIAPVTIEYLEVDASAISEAAILAMVGVTQSNDNVLGTGGTAGVDDGNETIVVYYNVAGSGNAIVLLDNIDDGTIDAAIKLTGINTAAEIALADFI